jgi:hypothetical protein
LPCFIFAGSALALGLFWLAALPSQSESPVGTGRKAKPATMFLMAFAHADSDIPIYQQDKAECARLQ